MSVKAMAWAWQTSLKGTQKLVLLALSDHADDAGRCWPGLNGLAAKCGLSRSSIIEHIENLVTLGLIIKQKRHDANGYRRSNIYSLNIGQSPEIQRRNNLRRDFESLSPDLPLSKVQNLDGNIIETSLESSIETSNICELKTSRASAGKIKTERKQSASAEVLEIFSYWQQRLNHSKAKLDGKRKRKIMQALKTYSVEELKGAIDGCAKSPYHMGQNNSGQLYDDIELILRDSTHIERFITICSTNSSQKLVGYKYSENVNQFAGAI